MNDVSVKATAELYVAATKEILREHGDIDHEIKGGYRYEDDKIIAQRREGDFLILWVRQPGGDEEALVQIGDSVEQFQPGPDLTEHLTRLVSGGLDDA